MRRLRWTWLVVAATFAIIIASWVLGLLSFLNLANPWFNPRAEVKAIRASTPRLYDTSDSSSRLYAYCEESALAIREGKLEEAKAILSTASLEDPANPLFDYLFARLQLADNSPDKAMSHIMDGNAKGRLTIYASNRIRPDQWNRLEVQEIGRMVREMVKVKKDASSLLALYDVGQKMVFCQPADFSVVSNGLFLRRFIAGKILGAHQDKLTPEAAQFFEMASRTTGPAWTFYEGGPERNSVSDPRNRLYIAMRMMRRGGMRDFVEVWTLYKDLEAQATSDHVQRRVRPRPEKAFK